MAKISLAISSISSLISHVFLRKCFTVNKQGHFSESLPRLHWTFASGRMQTYKQPKTSHLDLYKEKEKASLLNTQTALGDLYFHVYYKGDEIEAQRKLCPRTQS